MPASLNFPVSQLLGFLFVLARTSALFVFIPLPGGDAFPSLARIVLSLAATVALFPRWPAIPEGSMTAGGLIAAILPELTLGMAIGLAVTFLVEAFLLGAQMLSLHAGYGIVTTIDPTSQADSGLIPVVVQLTAGLLLFTTGLDRELVRALAISLDRFPPAHFAIALPAAAQIARLGAQVFSVGLRLALPVLALMLMLDIAIALLNRMNQQLQLLSLAFSLKMLFFLPLFAGLLLALPALYGNYAHQALTSIRVFLAAGAALRP